MLKLRFISPLLTIRAVRATATQGRLASDSPGKSFESKKSALGHRHHIDRQSYENTSSNTDDAVAGQDVSYQRSKSTDPEEAKQAASADSNSTSPLEVSAANPKVSTFTSENEPGAKSKVTSSYHGVSSSKSKSNISSSKKVSAGFDKRKPDSPKEVASRQHTLSPRSR
jgi:hypothetical protein